MQIHLYTDRLVYNTKVITVFFPLAAGHTYGLDQIWTGGKSSFGAIILKLNRTLTVILNQQWKCAPIVFGAVIKSEEK